MPTLAFRFPGGRYHATPWDRHVNEGEVEWPPSPWRLLRSLVATGFTRLGWTTLPDEARQLIDQLASVHPSFRLPPATTAHTRHYMPIHEGRKSTTTKVIDAFVRVSPGLPLLAQFPISLDPASHRLLRELVAAMTYLGRAESWCDVTLVDDDEVDEDWCRPAVAPVPGGDQVPRLALLDPTRYRAWRDVALVSAWARAGIVEGAARLTPKQRRAKAAADVRMPAHVADCLLVESGDLRKEGWSQPPGSEYVMYARPADLFRRWPTRPERRQEVSYEVALLALDSDTVRGTLLPLLGRALPQAELLHQALVARLGDDARSCPALTGKDAQGRRLEGHRHAHLLPIDLDEDGRIDHVLVYAPSGLDLLAQRAIRAIRRTWSKGIDADIAVTCAGFGSIDLLARQLRTRSGQRVPILGEGRTWASVTPFVPVRHAHRRRDTLLDQVEAECASRGLPSPESIEIMDRDELVARSLLKFVRRRREGKPQPPGDGVFGLRLRFANPLRGPLALGYASHYGIGLFGVEE